MKTHDLTHELSSTAAVFGRNNDVSLVFEGDGAYTDGNEIVLPSIPQGAEVNHDTVMMMRGYLDHEAGHVRHTDFETFRKFAASASDQARAIHNCLEDMWLEKKVMEEYPGAQKNLTKLTEIVGVKEQEVHKAHPEVFNAVTADAICNSILRAGRLEYGGQITQDMFNDMLPKFQEWGKKWAELAHNAKSTKELCNLALEIEKLLEATSSSADMSKPEPEEGGKGLEGDPQDFEFDPEGDVTGGKPARKDKEGQPKDGKGKPILTKPLSKLAGEWIKSETDSYFDSPQRKSGKYTVMTTRFDEVYERGKKPKHESGVLSLMERLGPQDYEAIRSKLTGTVNVMKARLRRALTAKELRDWDFGREYGRLDSKRIVAGTLGAQNVYKARKDRQELDTAVHFLVDLSGSMGGKKIQVACESVVALSECLDGTQIAFQVTGFSNYGAQGSDYHKIYEKADKGGRQYNRTEPLRLHKFKKFNEPLQTARGAIAAISGAAGGNNSDRDAVVWAYQELKKRPEKRKILFVLSDGQPANDQLNGGVCLVKALKNAVGECTKAGVECIGIGILDQTVKEIYPKAVSITNVNDLSGTIFTQLSNLLTGGKVSF